MSWMVLEGIEEVLFSGNWVELIVTWYIRRSCFYSTCRKRPLPTEGLSILRFTPDVVICRTKVTVESLLKN